MQSLPSVVAVPFAMQVRAACLWYAGALSLLRCVPGSLPSPPLHVRLMRSPRTAMGGPFHVVRAPPRFLLESLAWFVLREVGGGGLALVPSFLFPVGFPLLAQAGCQLASLRDREPTRLRPIFPGGCFFGERIPVSDGVGSAGADPVAGSPVPVTGGGGRREIGGGGRVSP